MGKTIDFLFQLDVAMSNKFQQPMRVLNGEFSKLQQAMQNLQRVQGNISAYERQTAAVNISAQKLGDLRGQLERSRGAAIDAREGQAVLAARVAAAQHEYTKLAAVLPKNSQELKRSRKELQDLQAAYSRSGTQAQKFEREQEKLTAHVSRAEGILQSEREKLSELKDALSQAGVNTSDLTGKQSQLQAAIERTAKAQTKLTSIREKLTWGNFTSDVMKSTAMLAPFKQPVTVAMNYEQAMAQVRAVSNPSPEDFMRLDKQAKLLGSSTQFSATQAANSQEVLMRAGLNTQQTLTTLPSVLSMAAAEGMSIEQAADIIVNAVKGLKQDVGYSPILADLFAYTSAHSNTNIAQLGEAMKIVAPVASDLNIAPEQIMSYLGGMTSAVRGAEAGTALTRSLQRLTGTPAAQKELARLGIGVKTREGKLAELPVILQQLDAKLSSYGEADRAASMKVVFGQFSSAMSALMESVRTGEQGQLELGNFTARDGASEQMAKVRNDTLKGDLTSLSSAWEGLMIKIGEALTPINRFVTQTLTTGIQKVTEFMNENRKLVDIALQVGYAFAGWKVLRTVWGYGKALLQLPGAYLETIRAARAAGEVMQSWGLLTKANTAIQWLWNAALNANPLGLFITLLTGAAVAIAALYHNWDTVKAYGTAAAQWCMTKWQDFTKWFESLNLAGIWESLKQSALDAIEWVKAPFIAFGEWLKNLFHDMNPFNWELPSWLGGGSIRTNTRQASNANAALQGYMPPEIPAHAFGGILTTPHVGLVAEAGPEAIIPLRDKARGIPLVQKAASILGLGQVPQKSSLSLPSLSLPSLSMPSFSLPSFSGQNISSLKELNDYVRRSDSSTINTEYHSVNNSVVGGQSPTINITVNGAGQDEQSLAERIAQAVSEALRNITSIEERVSYA